MNLVELRLADLAEVGVPDRVDGLRKRLGVASECARLEGAASDSLGEVGLVLVDPRGEGDRLSPVRVGVALLDPVEQAREPAFGVTPAAGAADDLAGAVVAADDIAGAVAVEGEVGRLAFATVERVESGLAEHGAALLVGDLKRG